MLAKLFTDANQKPLRKSEMSQADKEEDKEAVKEAIKNRPKDVDDILSLTWGFWAGLKHARQNTHNELTTPDVCDAALTVKIFGAGQSHRWHVDLPEGGA